MYFQNIDRVKKFICPAKSKKIKEHCAAALSVYMGLCACGHGGRRLFLLSSTVSNSLLIGIELTF